MRARMILAVALTLVCLAARAGESRSKTAPFDPQPRKLGSLSKVIGARLNRMVAEQVEGHNARRALHPVVLGPLARASAYLIGNGSHTGFIGKLWKPKPVRPWKSKIKTHRSPW